MSAARQELQEALCRYIGDTLNYIDTTREFCERSERWMLGMKREVQMMMDIKDRADNIDLSMDHVTQSENRFKAFWEYMKSKATQVTADSRRAELERELAAVLEDTLGGLENLDSFLGAVENLAVTSLHVFTLENQVLRLPEGIGPDDVQLVIAAARKICPHLLVFKRDASGFFLPKLQNMEALSHQLNKYIQTTLNICGELQKSSLCDFSMEMNKESLVDLDVDLSEDDVQMMLSQINELDEIRMNQSFRTVFLFQGKSSDFISDFHERRAGMLQSLNELEEHAVQLDRMNTGANISSVAGSSVGAVGGVLSVVGFALMPVTGGASAALTVTGLGLVMGITSGVNSVVTTATEIGINSKHQKKASEIVQRFIEDVQSLQDCLEHVTEGETNPMDVVLGVSKMLYKAGAIGKGIDSLIDAASAIKGPLALSKSAKVGLIRLNALFVGLDVFFICKDSISLAKGCKTEVSQLIRARAVLWRSEMDSWQKIYDFLIKGLPTSESNTAVLEKPFYPKQETKKHSETGMKVDGKKKRKSRV